MSRRAKVAAGSRPPPRKNYRNALRRTGKDGAEIAQYHFAANIRDSLKKRIHGENRKL
jgi:hypothetical protein